MNSTVSKSSSICVPRLGPSNSLATEISQSPLSTVSSPNDLASITWSEESFPELTSSVIDNPSEQASKNVKSTINSEGGNKSKRRKIMVISIIILLILIAVALIITLVIVLKSQNSTNETKTTITTGNSISYFGTTVPATTPIIYAVGDGGAGSSPPCSSHTVINDPLRNIGGSGIGGSCDNGPLFNTSIGGRWIRFIGSGGAIMPLTSPGMNHCGAFLAGWFNGSLPSTTGTIVNGKVYFETYAQSSGFSASASVINCGSFYVYFLPPVPACNGRYCTV